MTQGLKLLPRQYKNKISKSSKIYCNRKFNEHQWIQVNNTKDFHSLILSEHANKDRIVGNALKMRFAIGYATNHTIYDENDEYFNDTEYLTYSTKPQEMKSPEVILSSNEMKIRQWDEKKAIENLLNRMYYEEASPLYHGFTSQHKHSFAMGISLFVKSGVGKMPENEAFQLALNSDSILLNESETKQYLLDPYYKNANFNSTMNYHPKKGQYPPRNRNEKQPPHFNDWYNSKGGGVAQGNNNGTVANDNSNVTSNALATILGQFIQSKNSDNQINQGNSNDLSSLAKKQIAVTFACQWNRFPESIIIDGDKLTNKSTMRELLLHCDSEDDQSFADDYNLGLDGNSRKLYFCVKTTDGFDEISIKKSRFLQMNIDDLQKLEHVHNQLTITIVDRK